MTVMRSIGNEHAHIGRLGAWCWTETGRTGKASIGFSLPQAFWLSNICFPLIFAKFVGTWKLCEILSFNYKHHAFT